MNDQFPFTFYLFHNRILWHVVAEPLAMLAGFRYYLYLRRLRGDSIGSDHRLWIIAGAIFGALAGSRIIGGLENIPQMLEAKNKLLYFYQNKTVVGGFFGGVLGVEGIKKVIRESRHSGDLFVFPMILALILGRIGCFSMGIYEETYGLPTNLFTGMLLGDGIFRHPVTLYEIVYLGILWLVLAQVEKGYWLSNGLLFKLFMLGYFLFRFLLDFIKPHFSIAGLSVIQLTCVAGILYYAIIYLKHPTSFSIKKMELKNA